MTQDISSQQIVASKHLAPEQGGELSELEYGMTMAYNAFSRWMVRCMAATGYQDFNPLDILVLHNVNHRDRAKRLVDIAFVLNIEDHHTVNYALKKLIKAELVQGQKQGKEIFYSVTEKGHNVCLEYRKVRDLCLIEPALATELNLPEIRKIAAQLRSLSGLYGQASRSAASL